MTKILTTILFLCTAGCISTDPETGAKRLLGKIPLPWTESNKALTEGPPDFQWMFQLLAVGSIALAIGSFWAARRITKRGLLVAGSGVAVSIYGLSMEAIQRSFMLFIPWVVGGLLVLGVVEGYTNWKESRREASE